MDVIGDVNMALGKVFRGNEVSYSRQDALVNLTKAISLQESSRDGKMPDYTRMGDNGTSAGAYQWNNNGKVLKKGEVPYEFQADAKAAGLSPTDFSPENQNKVALATITKMYNRGMSPDQIAAAWNAGEKRALDGSWKTNVGYTVIAGKKIKYNTPAYVKAVNKYYNELAAAYTVSY